MLKKPKPLNHNAIHEAGHVIAALCFRLTVTAVLIKPSLKYAARCEISPTQTVPIAVYGLKIAGSVAVDIQNEKTSRNDDNGFGEITDLESDAASVDCIIRYWKNLSMTDEAIGTLADKWRASVKQGLLEHWCTVEALAKKIAQLTLAAPSLSASEIGKIVRDTEPAFYEQVKEHLQ